MPWRRATFKGDAEVWVEVRPDGQPKAQRGRVAMRYSRSARAKVYKAAVANVAVSPEAPLEELGGGGKGGAKGSPATKGAGAVGDPMPDGAAVAWTDGACSGNPGPTGAGAVIYLPDGRSAEAAKSLGRGTNNIGELTAIGLALELLDEAGFDRAAPVVLHTDSSYAIGVLTKGWKAKKNTALILGLREQLGGWPGLELRWVRGHVGTAGNERADALARAGAQGSTTVTWS